MYEKYVKLREEKGVKDSEVARETGIARSMFSEWKNGKFESHRLREYGKVRICLTFPFFIDFARVFGRLNIVRFHRDIVENGGILVLFCTRFCTRKKDGNP